MSKNSTYINKMKLLYSVDKTKPVPSNIPDIIGCRTSEFKNELIVFRHTKKHIHTYKAFVTNVQVIKGKIIFFLNNGHQTTYENKNLVNDICSIVELPSPNKYDSFWGKKSILKHHSSKIFGTSPCYGAIGDGSSLYHLSELLYHGGTTFILEDYSEFPEALDMAREIIEETRRDIKHFMLEKKTNCTNSKKFMYFDPNRMDTLHLTDNDRPFPPDYYERIKFAHALLNGKNTSVNHDNISFEADNNCAQESEYEYKNDLCFFLTSTKEFSPYRLFITDIEVTNGKITFFVEDGPPIIIEDKFLMNTFRTDNEGSCPNTYKSFLGKESILKHHFKHVYPINCFFYWSNEVESCYANIITEVIHDGVTTFIINDFGDSEADLEHIGFPDGIYTMDGIKVAENWRDFDTRYPDSGYYNDNNNHKIDFIRNLIMSDEDDISF